MTILVWNPTGVCAHLVNDTRHFPPCGYSTPSLINVDRNITCFFASFFNIKGRLRLMWMFNVVYDECGCFMSSLTNTTVMDALVHCDVEIMRRRVRCANHDKSIKLQCFLSLEVMKQVRQKRGRTQISVLMYFRFRFFNFIRLQLIWSRIVQNTGRNEIKT